MNPTRLTSLCLLLLSLFAGVWAKSRKNDRCNRQPTINGLCVTSTLGIYYDRETQKCKFMGCSPEKKLFATLEDCEKICNNARHRRNRMYPLK